MMNEIAAGEFTIPDDLSPACSDLIRKMVTVMPQDRMSISDIASHEWLKIVQQPQLPARTRSVGDKTGLPPLGTVKLLEIPALCRDLSDSEATLGIVSPFLRASVDTRPSKLPEVAWMTASSSNMIRKESAPPRRAFGRTGSIPYIAARSTHGGIS
jgi:serine/threonine protein kinase